MARYLLLQNRNKIRNNTDKQKVRAGSTGKGQKRILSGYVWYVGGWMLNEFDKISGCLDFSGSSWGLMRCSVCHIPHICHFFYTDMIFENQILHPKKRLKSPKTLKMSLKKSYICIFFTHSGKIYTWQKFFTQTCLWCLWQIWGMLVTHSNIQLTVFVLSFSVALIFLTKITVKLLWTIAFRNGWTFLTWWWYYCGL